MICPGTCAYKVPLEGFSPGETCGCAGAEGVGFPGDGCECEVAGEVLDDGCKLLVD